MTTDSLRVGILYVLQIFNIKILFKQTKCTWELQHIYNCPAEQRAVENDDVTQFFPRGPLQLNFEIQRTKYTWATSTNCLNGRRKPNSSIEWPKAARGSRAECVPSCGGRFGQVGRSNPLFVPFECACEDCSLTSNTTVMASVVPSQISPLLRPVSSLLYIFIGSMFRSTRPNWIPIQAIESPFHKMSSTESLVQ